METSPKKKPQCKQICLAAYKRGKQLNSRPFTHKCERVSNINLLIFSQQNGPRFYAYSRSFLHLNFNHSSESEQSANYPNKIKK